jgi:hypothetical protein
MLRRRASLFAYLIVGFLGSSVIVAQETAEQPAEIHGTLLSAETDSFMLRGVLIISAGPSIPSMVGKTKILDTVGTFDIRGVRPGRYFFTPEGPQAAVTYFKQIECGGLDYSARPLQIQAGDVRVNCKLTFARDSGAIAGRVLHGRVPIRAFQVVAIPEEKELRSVFGHWAVSWPPTRRDGRFEVTGIIPGDYLIFAVPAVFAKSYIPAIDFDDRIYASAQKLTIRSHETATIALEETSPKP